MPYRDRNTVESWISEYLASRAPEALHVAVLDKNFESGPNSGLVVVELRTASTITYAHPVIAQGVPRWIVTFEPRSEALDLDTTELEQLSADIGALSGLCIFLQMKTDAALLAHDSTRAQTEPDPITS